MDSRAVKIFISGPILTSIINESPDDNCDENTHGLLFGNYRTKRNISMTDSSEKDESLELGITISHYVCSNSRRPTPPKHHTNRQRNDVCLGMFVIRPDTQLYPTFKDMETLNAIIPTQEHQPDTNNTHSRGHTYSTTAATAPPPPPPLLLLMLSVPRLNRHHQRRSDAAGWMYNLKHVCFTYCRGSSPPFATALLKVPSLAPDLQGEFAAVTCLDASCGARRGFSDSAGAMDLDAVGHGGLSGALSRQFAVMAASGMVQVVDTELLAAGVIDSIKGELGSVLALQREVEALRGEALQMAKQRQQIMNVDAT